MSHGYTHTTLSACPSLDSTQVSTVQRPSAQAGTITTSHLFCIGEEAARRTVTGFLIIPTNSGFETRCVNCVMEHVSTLQSFL